MHDRKSVRSRTAGVKTNRLLFRQQKNLKGLQNQKDCKYNKEWVAKRLKIEEKRCRCVKKCEKKWNDVEAK